MTYGEASSPVASKLTFAVSTTPAVRPGAPCQLEYTMMRVRTPGGASFLTWSGAQPGCEAARWAVAVAMFPDQPLPFRSNRQTMS